jgi:tetratricopeptide (TPR) repeat protein
VGQPSRQNRAIEESADSVFFEGQQAYKTGQFQKAISIWEQVPPDDPHYIDAQLGIREARLQIEHLQQEHRLSEQTRSQLDALIAEANDLEQSGDLAAAVQKYEEARQLDPKNIVLYNKIEELHALLDDTLARHIRLGDLYLAQGQYEKSQAEWERLLLLDPDNEKAQQRLADIEVLTATSDTVFMKRGRALFEKGLVNAARAEFEKARRVNPDNELTLTYLAQLENIPYTEYQVAKGDTLSSIAQNYSGKVSYFQVLADFNTLDSDAALKVGQVINIPHILEFKNALSPDESEIILEVPEGQGGQQSTVSRTLPAGDSSNNTETQASIDEMLKEGISAFQEGNYRKAVELLQIVLVAEPENELAYDYFVEATGYIRSGTSAVGRTAEESGEQTGELELSEAQRLTNEALSLQANDNFKQALALFEQAYQLDPTIPGLLENLEETRDSLKQQITAYLNEGIKYFNQDSLEDAIEAWDKVLALDPTNRQAAEYKERAETLLETFSPQ